MASLTTSVATNASDLAAEVSARTTQVATQNESIATLDQDITTVASNLASEVTTLETAIANVGTDTAAVTQIVNTRVNPLEEAVEASYVLRATANNTVAGFSLFNSTDEPSTFDIVADRFSVSPSYQDYGTAELINVFDILDWRDGRVVVVDNYFGNGVNLLFDSNRDVEGYPNAVMYFHYYDARDAGMIISNMTMRLELGGNRNAPPETTMTGPPRYLFTSLGHQYWGIKIPQSAALARAQSLIRGSVIEGGSTVTPFTVDGTTGTVFMNAAMIKDATITNAMIENVAAEKVTAIELSSIAANLGSITAGSLTGPNGRFQIDLANNRLDVYDENGVLRVRLGDLS